MKSEITSYDDLKNKMQTHFGNTGLQESLLDRLDGIKQGRLSVREFADRILDLESKIRNTGLTLQDHELKRKFFNGLHENLRKEVRRHKVDTFDEAVAKALDEETDITLRRDNDLSNQMSNLHVSAMDWRYNGNRNNARGNQNFNTGGRFMSRGQNNFSRKPTFLCFGCGLPGHLSRNCRFRQRFNYRPRSQSRSRYSQHYSQASTNASTRGRSQSRRGRNNSFSRDHRSNSRHRTYSTHANYNRHNRDSDRLGHYHDERSRVNYHDRARDYN